ncbi:hypothetical protein RCH33_3185 [Flavobacterium daejeonense]|nr:hypothetical protein RCH33_3185 [Flavobacterium daejeonense]
MTPNKKQIYGTLFSKVIKWRPTPLSTSFVKKKLNTRTIKSIPTTIQRGK